MSWNNIFSKCILSSAVLLITNAVLATEAISVELADGRHISDVRSFNLKLGQDDLSILNVIVGTSKLSDVKDKLGGDIYHEGDAGSSIYLLCYLGSDGSIVTFESGELGGSDHTVTTASIFGPNARYRFDKKCIKSSKVNAKLSLGNIHLGIPKDAAKKLKGTPSKDLSDLLLYEFRSTEVLKNEKFDVNSSIEMGLSSNKVSYISVSKTESN